MDCLNARTLLEASRPERRDWHEPELRAAAAHAEQCADCQSALAERDQWDATVASVLQQVELPKGLEARLLTALAIPPAVAPAPLVTPAALPRRRRGWQVVAAATVLLAASLVLVWNLRPVPPASLSVEEVFTAIQERFGQEAAALEHAPSTPFDGAFPAPLPDADWSSSIAQAAPWGIDLDGRPGHDAAVYRFEQGPFRGLLVVLPRAALTEAPEATLPLRSNYRYVPRPHVAWSVGEQVYLCVLEQGNLDAWQRQFYGTAA